MGNEILAYIPARGGSKRLPHKNVKEFQGKPLIAHTIEHAQQSSLISRIIVDTDSEEIAEVAKKYGAEVPYLRPKHLAQDTSQVIDAIIYLLDYLRREEGYEPDYLSVLQTTSPLRIDSDITRCWEELQKGDATSVATVSPTHPQLYYLKNDNYLSLANAPREYSSNTQDWQPAYLLNGCIVYITETNALRKERNVITSKAKAVICPKWRSVDVDTPEEWYMAEILYKNKEHFNEKLG